MASGYARWRPPIHPLITEKALDFIGLRDVGLDVGCGAGLSTRALQRIAARCIGIDPVEDMIRSAGDGVFVVAAAEALPLIDSSVDVISAAGSLNYVDPARFFPEALRVLTSDGVMLVYDFSPGRSFREDGELDDWFEQFRQRYPPPAGAARFLDPGILGELATGFLSVHSEEFTLAVKLTPEFYLEYMLTETSVSYAVRSGIRADSIRQWSADSLAKIFVTPRDVLFRGYFVILRRE